MRSDPGQPLTEPISAKLKGRMPSAEWSGIAAAMRPKCDRQVASLLTIEPMAIKRMEHVGIVGDDLPAAIEFFVELGLEPRDKGPGQGQWVEPIALDEAKMEFAMLRSPDGHGEIELVKVYSLPTQTGDRSRRRTPQASSITSPSSSMPSTPSSKAS